MATRTVVCPECAQPLPPGRLACPFCGALLATAAGAGPGSNGSVPAGASDPAGPTLAPDDEPAAKGEVADDAGTEVPTWPEPSRDEPQWPTNPSWPQRPAQAGTPDRSAAPTWPDPSAASWPPAAGPSWPEPAGASMPHGVAPTGAGSPVPYVPAGASMPPSAAFAAEPAPGEPEKGRAGDAPLLADLPFDAPDDLAGWMVAIGSGIATVGFLLPWAHRLIASAGEDYFSAWGLGALMHLPVFAAAIVTLGLAVLPNRVAPWLRTGVLPLALGGMLLGLAWPYVFVGALRGQFGSVLELAAGLILVAGGVLALQVERHGEGSPRV